MAYRFAADEAVADNVHRVGREQLDRAVQELTDGVKADPEKAIHAARKALKKERSLLRLTRGALPTGARRHLNTRLRDTAAQLGATRDADAVLGALDELRDRFAGQVPAATFDAFRAHLETQRDATRDSAGSVSDAAAELRAAREEIASLRVRGKGFGALGPGLERTYKRGRRAMRRAQRKPTDENLHEWRKRAKDQCYHLRVLRDIAPDTLSGHVDEAHALADLLGDDHDLAVLTAMLRSAAPELAVDVGPLFTLVEHRRRELQGQARWAGARVYAESTSAFTKRLRRYWKASRAQTRAAREQHPAELAASSRKAAAV